MNGLVLPKNYSLLNEEMSILHGGSWSYGGYNWNDSPLYASQFSKGSYDMVNKYANKLIDALFIGTSFLGPIGQTISTLFGVGKLFTSVQSFQGQWSHGVNFCFQNGVHSNLYFTSYNSGSYAAGYSSPWIYTN